MFVCLAVFFGMGSTVKDVSHLMASAVCGPIRGQLDLLLMTFGAFGLILCGVCAWGQGYGVQKFPLVYFYYIIKPAQKGRL